MIWGQVMITSHKFAGHLEMYDFPLRGEAFSGWRACVELDAPFLLIFGRFASSFQVKLEWKLYIFKHIFHLDMYIYIYMGVSKK